ncbi:uncharacterized protein SEPMUDRAFT_128143 [Sphaerulina musiva SO2202]|uniref:Uncharacterized protein n=1 Tax=Sphaerulina musiva (strain SO2202) TaxID=692275 RepID=N1QG03_SPHMS|nr:uncharacterized protein SEPMUDRAFT_128143 [Sphaerulina musiva SO2202]EMF09473.1 hypothetical protein SEPMUDRAFT_128143 [Sphaerulina musiva SO2202]
MLEQRQYVLARVGGEHLGQPTCHVMLNVSDENRVYMFDVQNGQWKLDHQPVLLVVVGTMSLAAVSR